MTNIIILSLSLIFSADKDFVGYSYSNPENIDWYISSNICYTAIIEFEAPVGIYEIWYSWTPQTRLIYCGDSICGSVGARFVRINDRITHFGGITNISFPIPGENSGFFDIRKYQ